ncbi:MAG: XTP/dITP diphosphatase [Dehalococcoidales bacterium]|nr:XTP/dITP diphosphatase [Dehalococcoidales bacterium]
MRKLLLATGNRGKAAEYRRLLEGIPFRLVTLAEEGITLEVEETGTTFAENAGLKAGKLAAASRLLTVADDSGIEVDALNGEPGIYSARYAGENASDEDRNRYLLAKLAGVPEEKRTARFRCVIAIAEPDGDIVCFTGTLEGVITLQPAGTGGFGYDPVLYLPSYGKTVAEIGTDVKNTISHRAIASALARRYLIDHYS